ncbi:SDR family oxidoreductase [Paenibacillus psychroresistens]|uniref:SDR family oxidoreductase n=1 Tax=Paenibacillus psychroresistens TaxID=1778678 RepID=A0A6B8RTT5_9BACL|nr:SDR family oxidoreductase [Paenibacillus psychroresistens]
MPTNPPIVLITGTSSGFGLLTAIALGKAGYHVIATMRDLSKQNRLIERATAENIIQNIECMQLDVTDEKSINQTIKTILAKYQRIDVLVNNAGYAVGGCVEDIPLEVWREQFETNFFGLITLTQAVLPIMRQQKQGKIINISSISGRLGFPGYAAYSASKFAVEGFSESLRHEMLPFGVYVVIVEPGSYKTEIWDKGFANMQTSPESAYRTQLEAVLRYSHKAAKTSPDPQLIADLIVRITAKASPKLRYPLGKGARLSIWGKALLPLKWFEWMLHKLL